MRFTRLAGSLALMLAAASQISGAPLQHLVTGSGEVEAQGVVFRSTVAAQRGSDGSVWGAVVVTLDLSVFGLAQTTFSGPVTCLEVEGNSAWIGSVVRESTNADVIPPGASLITLVRDLGGEGEDVLHGELEGAFPPGTTCADRPALLETVARSGNFQVQ